MNLQGLEAFAEGQLVWLPELGMGYYPVQAQPYDDAYWERYRAMDRTPCGETLTAMRQSWVRQFYPHSVCDVGIGGGRFVEDGGHWGFDVNPRAVDWLIMSRRHWNPYEDPIEAVTFWDSLEHIHNPGDLLRNVERWAFVSLPIFSGAAHIRRSKHFRKDEHCLYFTRDGFVDFMGRHGFDLAGESTMEQSAGREDIQTFAFCRRGVR
jgi:hypothetical protein